VASASGGVWKSSDGGLTWKPIFDDQPIGSIGSLAVAASDPNVIYVGSGEGNPRGNVAPGNGIYKSTDAGKTWKHVWKQEGQIGTMVVHPTNPDIAYAAVLGHAFGPNPERGVYRTTNGGATWERVLFKDAETGACDLCMDPNNPRILFAGLWQMRRRPWEMTSGGPGSGLYQSRDGGDTWKQLKENGLPEGIYGRIGLAIAPSDSRRIYAVIENEKGGLFRSDDGGEKWQRVSPARYLRQRPWYFSTMAVDSRNPDLIYFCTVRLLKSIDGGKTFRQILHLHHGDHHDLWIDPKNPKRMIGSNDGGVDITTNGGETWYAPPLPIAQFYHINCDTQVPYHVSGCIQDFNSASGPSNSLCRDGILLADWHEVGGGEAGFTAADPADPNVLYAGEYGGLITRYDHRLRQARPVGIYPTNPSGHGAEDLRYRFQWTAPILISPHDSKVVYHAANVLFKTTDGGQTWKPISPDLTRNDKSKQKWSGGPITGDNTGVEVYGTIFAMAESPRQRDLLWAGSDDGLLQVSSDGGNHWEKISDHIDGFPEWGTVKCIEPSPFDAQTAYVVVDAHRLDNMRPYLFKTTDLGRTWKSLSANLPQDIYLHAVREDPKKKGMLYAGTERGVIFSADDGHSWRELKLNLPTVAVHDLIVKDNDLVLGTHGRSIWILDDLTALREWTPDVASKKLHLFSSQPALRYRYHEAFGAKGLAPNPPVGAVLHYYLKDKPKGELTIDILDEQGKLVHRLTSKEDKEGPEEDDPDRGKEKKKPLTIDPGVNRAVWNLTYLGARLIKEAKIDTGEIDIGPLVNPGKYTAKLAVDGLTATTSLEVLMDPRCVALSRNNTLGPNSESLLTPEDLQKQLSLALKIRDDLSRLSDAVNRLRAVRKQLLDRNEMLRDDPKGEALIKETRKLLDKLDALEAKLHNPKAEVIYDILAMKGGAQLYSKLALLFEYIRAADGPPAQGLLEEYAAQARELDQYLDELAGLFTGDLHKLNEMAKSLDYPITLVPAETVKNK
jgi:photosystem II stability/assembly factor-like uncharacterized protein